MTANKNSRTVQSERALINSEHSDIPNEPKNSLEEDRRVTAGKRSAHNDGHSPRKRKKVARQPTEVSVIDLTETSDEELSTRKRVDSHPTEVSVIDLTQTSDEELPPVHSRTKKRARRRLRTPSNLAGEPTKVSVNDLRQTTSTGTSSSQDNFEAKYEQRHKLGQGGFGCVYAGFRKTDNLPVAIKRMAKRSVTYQTQVINGQLYKIPVEVIMQRLAAGDDSIGKSAAVSLLDWYDLGNEVVLVMERPVPCINMNGWAGGAIEEHEAKDIMRQMAFAANEMHSRGVFHQDIKMENLLIEESTGVPRVRVIDFGCGSLVNGQRRRGFHGTHAYFPPEVFMQKTYEPSPTTVWQLGAMMYELLTGWGFDTKNFLLDNSVFMNHLAELDLSQECKDFLMSCLSIDSGQRAKLILLPLHPWLY